ncbi:MAG: PilZ domain-containing protein [Spirochaetales bacterium]|nr:PilZ domain-containing protein [Spirochaetales bacterium]
MEEFIEKRRYQRINASFDVLIGLTNEAGINEFFTVSGRAVNISLSGILLKYVEKIPVGTTLTLDFFLPNSQKTINIDGKVVRSEPDKHYYLIAVEFTKIDEAMNEHLGRIMSEGVSSL